MLVTGRGGGKKATAPKTRPPQEAPNTLQSKSVARLVDVISEGEIRGLVNGLQSVYLDGTPLQNADGSYNFQGIKVNFKDGDPAQTSEGGFSLTENEISVGVEVTQATPVVRTITDSDLDALRVKIRLPQLVYSNTSNGDLLGSSVTFRIEVQENGGSYVSISSIFQSVAGVTTSSSAVGIRVTVYEQVTGIIGSRTSATLTAEYRTGVGAWTSFGTVTVPVDIPLPDGQVVLGASNTVTVSHTFTVSDLAAAVYEVRTTNDGFKLVEEEIEHDLTISGKTTSPYERSYRVPLPKTGGGAPWNIKVTRITADSDNASTQNQTFWSTYTEIVDQKFIYPDTAVAYVEADAELFGQELPERAYEVYGILCQVPSNYDPETRDYTGIWDGTFQTAWTDNPAWILYEVMTNTRFGLGDYIDVDQVDKYSLYDIGQYCDELVDDGYGGQEPRFTCNGVLNSRQQAYDVLNALASVFRGMLYWGTGAVVATQDSPSDEVAKLVTPANVEHGEFTYSGSGLRARHTAVLVSWNDPLEGYESTIAVVQDPELVNLYGWRQLDTAAFMCSSRGQAIRFGKWILDSERYETEKVSYTTSFEQMDLTPGSLIKIQDPSYAGVRFGGRLISVTGTTVVLDDEVTLQANETYTLSAVLPDGTVEDRAITSVAGTYTTITITSSFTATPINGAMWVITGTDVEPRTFRVIAVVEKDRGKIEVTALLHSAGKYDRVENGLVVEEPVVTIYPKGALRGISGLSVTEYLYKAGPAIKSAVTLSWTAPVDPRVSTYEVEYKPPGAPEFQYYRSVRGTSVDFLDVLQGEYTFRVTTVGGLFSLKGPTYSQTFTLQGILGPPSDVENFKISVLGSQAHLSWDPVTDLDLAYYQIRFSPDLAGVTWGSAAILIEQVSKDATAISVPSMVGTYLIKAADINDPPVFSTNASLIETTIAQLDGFNAIEVITEHTAFLGDYIDTYKTDGNEIRLSGSDYVSDWAVVANIPSWAIGEDGVASVGYYYFFNTVDLTQVYTSRITPTVKVSGVNVLDFVSDWGLVSERESWAGDDPSKWNVEFQISATNNDPLDSDAIWTDYQTLIIGDYSGRGFRFRVKLTSLQIEITPSISELSVSIDMPDRIYGQQDITSGAGTYSVVFSPAFKATPEIAIAAQNMATGDYFVISNKSRTGFDIVFRNSGGTAVSRSFDFHARGYGYVVV